MRTSRVSPIHALRMRFSPILPWTELMTTRAPRGLGVCHLFIPFSLRIITLCQQPWPGHAFTPTPCSCAHTSVPRRSPSLASTIRPSTVSFALVSHVMRSRDSNDRATLPCLHRALVHTHRSFRAAAFASSCDKAHNGWQLAVVFLVLINSD